RISFLLVILGGVSSHRIKAAQQFFPGLLKAEQYQGIGGNTIGDLTNNAKYPDQPDVVAFVKFAEFPAGGDDGSAPPGSTIDTYGTRLSGFVIPKDAASYVFFISTDDNGSLYLSTDDTPANLKLIAYEPAWNGV